MGVSISGLCGEEIRRYRETTETKKQREAMISETKANLPEASVSLTVFKVP